MIATLIFVSRKKLKTKFSLTKISPMDKTYNLFIFVFKMQLQGLANLGH